MVPFQPDQDVVDTYPTYRLSEKDRGITAQCVEKLLNGCNKLWGGIVGTCKEAVRATLQSSTACDF
ncbi:hypothetical protein DCS_05769 [Drechmeria coniospora]|uniref:Uncharacterized protein n=1 Tax=Drechmeria coniospora TaxID=98403 RepID=A0A151GNY4_DRECN|nr:hypothetical protein DCS_05769 [Drechmeria coniospora]KYK58751.1 hypothetical protein DCS_05769 [Drechmeria coniospora]